MGRCIEYLDANTIGIVMAIILLIILIDDKAIQRINSKKIYKVAMFVGIIAYLLGIVTNLIFIAVK